MRTFEERVDPELLPGLAYSRAYPPPTSTAGLAAFRDSAEAPVAAAAADGVTVRDCRTAGPGAAAPGAGDLRLRVFTPPGPGPHPAVYWIHGGGMIAGSVDLDTGYCAALCARVAAVVVAVEYRLAPEHPFPAPLEDVAAGLRWLVATAAELDVDPARVAVAGSSAGAGLAAALTLLARDEGGPAIAFSYLMYPMLDASHASPSAREFTDIPTWNRGHSEFAWGCYLGAGWPGGDADGTSGPPSSYAVPALAADLAGLPPTLVQTGELDLFRDEDISFAARLLQAGVPTELHVYPGAYHGFELNRPHSRLGRQCLADRDRALLRALHPPARRPAPTPDSPGAGSGAATKGIRP